MTMLEFEICQLQRCISDLLIWQSPHMREKESRRAIEKLAAIQGKVCQMELELEQYRKLLGERLETDTGDMLGVDES